MELADGSHSHPPVPTRLPTVSFINFLKPAHISRRSSRRLKRQPQQSHVIRSSTIGIAINRTRLSFQMFCIFFLQTRDEPRKRTREARKVNSELCVIRLLGRRHRLPVGGVAPPLTTVAWRPPKAPLYNGQHAVYKRLNTCKNRTTRAEAQSIVGHQICCAVRRTFVVA